MSLTLNDLANLLNEYQERLKQAQANVQQLIGSIGTVQNQINMLVQKQNESNLKEQQGGHHAIEEGKQPESNSTEHQDGDCSGQESEASCGDCVQ
ncbi:TPA: hypothetical protein JAG59_002024 [Legionella pneumophila]|nr:hypothetical protein [Legionella pneumophila]HAT5922963.1 hypothetical protein [Legionella pneumophila]HAT5934489.1 hypothetical protein [Legionella pneumophila]HAT5950241.1 hypothetical protein [Legionella pneumophila]HAT5962126.1 hypothetical protein [Legionella pneumophila]